MALEASAVDEPCPPDAPFDRDQTDVTAMLGESARLEPMLGVVLQYGSALPDRFGGYGLHWFDAQDASVFVSFTGDITEDRAALAEVVEYPDELIVCQAPASERDRRAIEATLLDELAGRFTSIGAGGTSGSVTVALDAGEEATAAELIERYGAAVDVTVGALDDPLSDATSVCGPALAPSLVDGLDVSIVDGSRSVPVRAAGTAAVTVRLANTGTDTVRFGSGQPSTVITDARGAPHTLDTRGTRDLGITIDLEPGEHQDVDLDVALTSCDPRDGYLIAAGEHFVVVSLYHAELRANMHSSPLPITIAD